jgi:flagellar motility protein MotE (MotC chaperone)
LRQGKSIPLFRGVLSMDLKLKDIVILVLVMLISFPIVIFVVLFITGNMRIEFGPVKPAAEDAARVELIKQNEKTDSLATANSKTWQAMQKEREDIALERKELLEERQKLELFQRDLETQKNEISGSRKKIETLVSRSDSLEKRKTVQLAKVYSAMRPVEAAQIIGTLQDELAARILDGISDDRQKAKILAALPQEKATRLTRLMGGSAR